jgi:hypothetical protein
MAGYLNNPGMAAWFGVQPGLSVAAQNIAAGGPTYKRAYEDELKAGAQAGKIMQEIRKLAAEADLAAQESGRGARMENLMLESAAARAGATVPEVMAAREALRGGRAGGVGPTGPVEYTNPADPRNKGILAALDELALSLASPGKWTPENIGGLRVHAAKEPGERARSGALEEIARRATGESPDSAYEVSGPMLGHHAPVERDQSAAFVKMLKAAGIDPASPEGRRLLTAKLAKESTHAPGTNVNVMPPSNEWVRGADGRWYKWRLGKAGQSELVPAPAGFTPGSPTEDPIRSLVRETISGQGGAPAGGAPKAPPKRLKFDAQGNRVK